MPGSERSGGGRDEPGKLIKFPYSQWIPEDGIERLSQEDGEQPSREQAGGSAELAEDSRASASDSDGFWASGETQEFVHVEAATGESLRSAAHTAGVPPRHRPSARMLTAALALGLIAGGVVFAGEQGGSQSRSFGRSLASVGPETSTEASRTPVPDRNVGLVPATARQEQRSRLVRRRVKTRSAPRESTATSASTEVVYHAAAGQPAYSPAQRSTDGTPAMTSVPPPVHSSGSSSGRPSTGSTGAATTSTGTASTETNAAAAPAANHPAFGANGALGPMSSPDG